MFYAHPIGWYLILKTACYMAMWLTIFCMFQKNKMLIY